MEENTKEENRGKRNEIQTELIACFKTEIHGCNKLNHAARNIYVTLEQATKAQGRHEK
jgi:hypothetical protein